MTNRQANIQAIKWLLLFLAASACLAVATPLIEAAQNLGLEVFERAIDARPRLWLGSIAGAAVAVVALAYFLYVRPRNPPVLTKRDWDKLYLERQGPRTTSFEKNFHRIMDMPGIRDSMLKQSRLDARERAELDQWEETRRKRSAEMSEHRLIDLPGYKSWSSQYDKLGNIIPNLESYTLLVHPDELADPLDEKFRNEFQGWLNDFAERRGTSPGTLNDYKLKPKGL